MRTATVLCPSS